MDTHASCSRCARAVPGTQNAAIEIRTQNTPETETRARREDGKVLVASFMPATEVFQSSSRGADGRARRLGDELFERALVKRDEPPPHAVVEVPVLVGEPKWSCMGGLGLQGVRESAVLRGRVPRRR